MANANWFHLSRQMFVIKEGQTIFAPANTTDSHIEWFEKEGWLKNNLTFLQENLRGFIDNEGVYFYRGENCIFNMQDKDIVRSKILNIVKHTTLSINTPVYGGMKIGDIGKKWQPIYNLGTIEDYM